MRESMLASSVSLPESGGASTRLRMRCRSVVSGGPSPYSVGSGADGTSAGGSGCSSGGAMSAWVIVRCHSAPAAAARPTYPSSSFPTASTRGLIPPAEMMSSLFSSSSDRLDSAAAAFSCASSGGASSRATRPGMHPLLPRKLRVATASSPPVSPVKHTITAAASRRTLAGLVCSIIASTTGTQSNSFAIRFFESGCSAKFRNAPAAPTRAA
mmetsp:Transcript_9224/g.30438  ORF Transcript_9224/g.30438 Transcript_9224/m.30438 type:complete len:212 (+) Transcript_9224:515-1150(+)